MAFGVGAGAARVRSRVSFGARETPALEPAGAPADFPELDCVRGLLPAGVIEAAAARALILGTGADRVLIATGALDEESYLRALARHLGVAFEPLDGVPRATCPLDDERLIEAAAQGMVALAIAGELALVVAPRSARRITAMIKEDAQQVRRIRFSSTDRINRFALRSAAPTFAARASLRLKQTRPALSAAPPRWRGNMVALVVTGLSCLAAATFATAATTYTVEIVLAMLFLAWFGLRLTGALADWMRRESVPYLPDDLLPTYSVIAALYREASSVEGLLSAIERLDYPAREIGRDCRRRSRRP